MGHKLPYNRLVEPPGRRRPPETARTAERKTTKKTQPIVETSKVNPIVRLAGTSARALVKRMPRSLVIIESPYAGDINTNIIYARRCVSNSLQRGESPIASHLLYTQPGILNDDIPEERAAGIAAGLAWIPVADKIVFYTDYGMSRGMQGCIDFIVKTNFTILLEYRQIGKNELLAEELHPWTQNTA